MASDKEERSVIDPDNVLLTDIEELIHSNSEGLLRNILADMYDFDISVLIDNLHEDEDAVYLFSLLSTETASQIILELKDRRRDYILSKIGRKKLSDIVGEMDSDDAADLVSELDYTIQKQVLDDLEVIDKEDSDEVRELMKYDESTAGGIMAKEFISVNQHLTVGEAVKVVQNKADEMDQFYNLWVVDDEMKLVGIISLKRLIIELKEPDQEMFEVMNPDVISVKADVDQQEVANIFKSYDLVSMPVVDELNRVIGKITIDDVIDVIEEEYIEDVSIMTGTDAEELEKKSSFEVAKLRLPWILITLGIELIAVFVIKSHNQILERIILLAAFMPIISAISGNTGLQSAAIVVRALDTGYVNIKRWWIPVIRQFKTTLIVGAVVGIITGIVGFLMAAENHFTFGTVVAISMFTSVNIAGLVGTIVPIISKTLGFDPALTSGPFETAFQDVVGITIFLTIATLLLSNI